MRISSLSIARSLLALACCCTSAAAAAQSAAELEFEVAREPAVYLRLDVNLGLLQVMIRGLEVERIETTSVELIRQRAAGHDLALDHPGLPAIWRVAAEPEVPWRRVVAPPTLVPYQEDAPPSAPAPTATPPAELPGQYHLELDNGWRLYLGPDPPSGVLDRLRTRITTGWRRLTRRPSPPLPSAIAVRTSADDSRRMLHLLRPGTAILVLCGQTAGAGEQPSRSVGGAGTTATSSTP